jgi:hypothetical protein
MTLGDTEQNFSAELVITSSEVNSILQAEKFVSAGTTLLCFKDPSDTQALLVPYFNPLGRGRMLELLADISTHAQMSEHSAILIEKQMDELNSMKREEYEMRTQKEQRRMIRRAKRQNYFYRLPHDDLIVEEKGEKYWLTTVPVKVVNLNEPQNILGISMAYVEGRHPDSTKNPNLTRAIHILLPDWHNYNAIITDKEKNDATEVVIIDF